MKYYNFDIVFAEIPDEVTLAINITNCPNRCVGCHSPHLLKDEGIPLDEAEVSRLIQLYKGTITCFCFMGGDADPKMVEYLSLFIKRSFPQIKTGWYSGKNELANGVQAQSFDYIKIGGYNDKFGPLNKPTTNQHLYRVSADGSLTDITSKFWRKNL